MSRLGALIAVSFALLMGISSHAGAGRSLWIKIEGGDRTVRGGAILEIYWNAPQQADRDIRVEVRRRGDPGWTTVATVPIASMVYRWRVDGPRGLARIRLAEGATGPISNTRTFRIVDGVSEVALNERFGVALHADGSLAAWGFYLRRFGGQYVHRRPQRLRRFPPIATIAAGGSSLLAVERATGEVWTWGDPDGDLGPLPNVLVPEKVPGLSGVTRVWTDYGKSFALLADGRVFAWGANLGGVLGDGTTQSHPDPVEIPALEGVIDLALGDYHVLALRADGTVLSWGQNWFGQLGDGSTASNLVPTAVPGLGPAVSIGARIDWSLAALADGTVWSWGDGTWRQLGRDAGDSAPIPGRVDGVDGIIQVRAGSLSGYARRSDGQIFAWGLNDSGELGDGTVEERPTPVPNLATSIDRFYVRDGTVHALDFAGRHIAWGYNPTWLVGDGTHVDRLVPVRIRD